MSIPTIPTAAEIKARIISDLETALSQTTPAFPKSWNRAIAGALAGFILLLYQVILWVYRQAFPETADERSLTLLGNLVNVFRLSAEFAEIQADVTGVNAYTIVDDLFMGSNSVVYKVTTGAVIALGTASVELTAQESGEIGNLPNGTVLDIVSPNPNLDGTATITATNTSGDDAESLDSFRARVSSAYSKRRTGGAPADYEAWGLETPNFDWISPLDEPDTAGEIQVYGRVDNQTDGIPSAGQLLELYDYLTEDPVTGLRTRHPIGPDVEPLAISRFEFDITISIQNGTTQIKADIETAVTLYVENQEPFNAAIRKVIKDTISEGGISSVANRVANPDSATVTVVLLEQVVPALTIQSYQLFGGIFGKVNTISFIDIV